MLLVVGHVAFALACGVVGVRLLWLATRTRRAPEALLGASLATLVVGFFVIAASGVAGSAGAVRLPVLGAGLGIVWVSQVLTSLFNWKIFRPRELWAAVLTGGVGGAIGFCMVRSVVEIGLLPPDASTDIVRKTWLAWMRAPMVLVYGWTLLEGWGHYRMATRRAAIGLGDPVITNRFALWAGMGGAALVTSASSIALQVQGRGPISDPAAAFAMSVGSLAAAACVVLAFAPPKAYLRFIEQRAEARAA